MLDSETEALVIASTERLLATMVGDHDPAWSGVAELGLPLALVAEAAGGFGLGPAGFETIVRRVAAADVALPIAETMVANMLIARVGGEPTVDPMVLAVAQDDRLRSVAWYPEAGAVLIEREDDLAIADVALLRADATGRAIDGSPRTDFVMTEVPRSIGGGGAGVVMRCGAALRTIQMAGVATDALALTIEHVNTRQQFGRPLARFQAIQQALAQMAAQVAVIDGAAGIAADFLAGDLHPSLALAAAKARASEAAGVVAAIAHQAHGAIGFTEEYRLGRLTKALWTWRADFGSAGHWQDVVGAVALAGDPDSLWAQVVAA